jgi:hypothetical protein
MPGLYQAAVVGSTLARWRPRLLRRGRVRMDSSMDRNVPYWTTSGCLPFSQDHRSSHLDLAGPMDLNGLRRLTRLVRTSGGGSSRWGDQTQIPTLVSCAELQLL